MSNNNLKTHYSAKELLELSLSCLPNSVQGIIYQAKKQGWESQKRVARGGGSEFALSSLPKEVQNEIYNKFTVALVQHKPNLPTVKQIDLENITTKQREIAGARMALTVAPLGNKALFKALLTRIKGAFIKCFNCKQGVKNG